MAAGTYLPPGNLASETVPGAESGHTGSLARARALLSLQRELEDYTRLPVDWDGYP
jgi:hypothetical protein